VILIKNNMYVDLICTLHNAVVCVEEYMTPYEQFES
jgi:hypothetical protein